MPMRNLKAPHIILFMVCCFCFLSSLNSVSTPILLDEFAHVPAGVSHWELGRFTLYRENPPFVRSLVSLPVWLSRPKTDYSRAGTGHRSEWEVGRDFIQVNNEKSLALFRRARTVVTMFAVACGILIFWWLWRSTGTIPAIIAAALWFSDPNVLAHATAATTDIGTAAVCLYACFFYLHFLRRPSRQLLLLAGFSLGLAEASKFSMLFLYPAWLILAVAYRCFHRPVADEQAEPRARFYTKVFSIILISIIIINAVYNFEDSFMPVGSYRFRSFALSGEKVRKVSDPVNGNRFAGSPLSWLPVPLPRNYLLGLDSQKWEEEIGLKNLSGGVLVNGGFWYSPFITLAYKLPAGTILYFLLSVFAIAAWVLSGKDKKVHFEDFMFWTLGGSFLILLCTQTGVNWPIRYALPAFPFLFMAVARCLRLLCGRPLVRYALLAPLLLNCYDLIAYGKYPISYGNSFAGGPEGAQKIFIGSNFDWGQDLFRLSQWWKDRPEPLPLSVSYYGVLDSEAVGLPQHGIPLAFWEPNTQKDDVNRTERGDFLWAISSNYLHGLPGSISLAGGQNIYASIHSPLLTPENAFARVGYSIYVFKISVHKHQDGPEKAISFDRLLGCIKESHQEDDQGIDATP